jgi:hypothetical protein
LQLNEVTACFFAKIVSVMTPARQCARHGKSWPVAASPGGSGRSTESGHNNGKQVDQGIACKAQQEPEGEMEGTETAAAAETP